MSDNLDLTLLKNCLNSPKLLCLLSQDSLWYLLSKANEAFDKKIGNSVKIKAILSALSFVQRKFILFFDNSKSNLEGLTKSDFIIPIKIEETKYFSKLCRTERFNQDRNNGDSFPIYESMVSYFNKLPDKAKNLGWFILMRNRWVSAYDELSGLRSYHLKLCQNGIVNGYIKKLVFDWDRTLTNFEGVFTYKNSSIEDINTLLAKRKNEFDKIAVEKNIYDYNTPANIELKDVATLYFGENYIDGGLKKLWKIVKAYDVEVYILTANPAASHKAKTRGFFLSLLKETGLDLPSKRLVCSKDYKHNKQWIIKNIL